MQLVLMSLFAGQEIGEEVHPDSDQFIRVERGNVVVSLNDSEYELQDGEAIIVPRGTSHNVVALADTKLYTIYSPATHPDGLVEEFQEFEN
jgi:quercetin dioxygenase-like cupin family protein